MKRYLFILLGIITIQITGCSKFLEQKSQDEIRPSSIQDLNQLMSAEGYPYQDKLSIVLNIITDDVHAYGGQGQEGFEQVMRKGRAAFTWSKQMFEELLQDGLGNVSYVNSWALIYKKIAGCNVVLKYVDMVSGGMEAKENLRGQALSMRAFYYFQLVNMFGKPYNAGNPQQSLGVPLKLRMEVTDSLYPRNSVAEVYNQIESDLLEGARLMEAYPLNNGIYSMNDLAAYALLSRVYLYMENWDKAIAYADKVITRKPGLSVLGTFHTTGGIYNYNNAFSFRNLNRIYDPAVSSEILWAYQLNPDAGAPVGESEFFASSVYPGYSATFDPPYAVSPELLALYDSRPASDTGVYLADLRSRLYFTTSGYFISFSPLLFGYKFYYGGSGGAGLRVGEVYLNRAEAKIRKAMQAASGTLITEALSDINTLRISRYDARQAYVPITITEPAALYEFYKEERRRELPFEGHRWFDLRRYGMPSISHFYEEVAGTGQLHTLEAGDARYTLPIPKEVLERNMNLQPNP